MLDSFDDYTLDAGHDELRQAGIVPELAGGVHAVPAWSPPAAPGCR
jgi:hypothetical protein